jgi:hypothetical protein
MKSREIPQMDAKRGDQIRETICFPLAEYNMALD